MKKFPNFSYISLYGICTESVFKGQPHAISQILQGVVGKPNTKPT